MTVYTWTGAIDTDTNNAGNWSPSGVPTSADDAVFDATSVLPCIWQLTDITNLTHRGGITLEFDAASINISGVMTIAAPISISTSRASVEFNFTGSDSVLVKYEGSDSGIWENGDTDKAKATFHIQGTASNIMFENGLYPIVKIGSSTTVSPHVPTAANNDYTETDFYQLTFASTGKFAETSAVTYSSDPREERNKVFRIRSIGTWSPERFEGGKAIWLFYATAAGFELPLTGSNISTATSFEGKVAQIRVTATSYGQKIKIPPGPHYLEKLTIDTGVMCICDRDIAELLMTNRPTIDGAWQFVQIADGIYRSAKEDMILPITHGGTGENDAQSAINALTQVSSATDEYVLTKDTTTGDALWKAAAGGGGGSSTLSGLTDTTITSAQEPQILVYDDGSSTWVNDTNDRLFIRVYNDTASTLSKGKVVYITGYQNANVAKVELAKADSSATMPAVGVIWEDVSAGAEGYIVALGKANGIAANFTAGDTLYVSPTTAGELTNTRPTSASHLVQNVGILFKPDASNAVMKVTGVGRTNDIPNQFSVAGTITASSLITSGGTSSDFVKGDGSLDSNTYLTSFTETDPVFSASPAAGISAPDITNWNTAYGWGDHAAAGYLTPATETDPVFAVSEANLFVPGDKAKLDSALQDAADVDISGLTATTTIVDTDLLMVDDGANGTTRKSTFSTIKDWIRDNVSKLRIRDSRADGDVGPNGFADKSVSFDFTDDITGSTNAWDAVITMKGWSDNYRAYQIWSDASSSSRSVDETPLFFRSGEEDVQSGWGETKEILTFPGTAPRVDGSAGQVLQTDGAGTLSWENKSNAGVAKLDCILSDSAQPAGNWITIDFGDPTRWHVDDPDGILTISPPAPAPTAGNITIGGSSDELYMVILHLWLISTPAPGATGNGLWIVRGNYTSTQDGGVFYHREQEYTNNAQSAIVTPVQFTVAGGTTIDSIEYYYNLHSFQYRGNALGTTRVSFVEVVRLK